MSSLGLADLRWRARRNPAGGPPLLGAGFLRAGDRRLESVIASLVAYFDSLLGCPRRDYRADVAAEIAGDRRLGQGLSAVLLDWYRWTPRSLSDVLPAPAVERLAAMGVRTPSELRLLLLDFVSAEYSGFVKRSRRDEALARFAGALGLDSGLAGALDAALTLDAEGEALLVRESPAPAPAAVIGSYNRALLAALLRQSKRIVVYLAEPDGALLRRMYARCRRLGVYCDVEGDGAGGFRLTLSGPEAVTGAPAAAGRQLAAASLGLVRAAGPLDRVAADLVIYDRPYRFDLDAAMLRLPGLAAEAEEPVTVLEPDRGVFEVRPASESVEAPAVLYDSGVEERFAREFESLRRQGRAAGWRLVREPAPLLAGTRVLIPDFALVRGALRVFVEVVGFWTPAYLERKRRALEQVPAETRLILATAEHAVPLLTGLPFPVVPYRDAVPVHDLLTAADGRYGDFSERTAGADERLAQLCREHLAEGWISERDLALKLGCLTPGEVSRVLAATPPPAGWVYVPSAGLLGSTLRDALGERLASAWTALPEPVLTLDDVRALLGGCALPERDQALAAILAHSDSCTVTAGALFAVEIRPPGWTPAAPAPVARASATRRRTSSVRPKPSAPIPPLF